MRATGQTSYYSLPPRKRDYFTNFCGQPNSLQILGWSRPGQEAAGRDHSPRARDGVSAPDRHAEVQVDDDIDLSTPRPFAEALWRDSLRLGWGSCNVGCVCGTWIHGI